MDRLIDFAEKDMIEQIVLLEEIKEGDRQEAVPALLALYAEPLADQAVDEMVYHALFELLEGQERQIVSALKHPSPRVQVLAVRRVGESVADSALPALFSLLENPSSPEVLAEVIRVLGNFRDHPGIVEKLLPFLKHEDYTVTAWAMRVLAGFNDPRVAEALKQLILADQSLAQGECDLRLAMAVENLTSFRDEETIGFLAGFIHHPCTSFRKEVVTGLTAIGVAALPNLEKCLEAGDKDEKIMAANVIGGIGDRQGADILVRQLHGQAAELDANQKFAIYEALGRIPSLRSLVGLSDGLSEENELVLMAVVTGIEQQFNPGVVKALLKGLDAGGSQCRRLLKAVITSRAAKLFAEVHKSGHREAILELLLASGDQEAMAELGEQLAAMEGEQAGADLQRLAAVKNSAVSRRILAADDSKAMLLFYKGVAAEMKVELITAADGREALEFLRSNTVEMLITDMNMPNMDGVELTREVRKLAGGASLPILMATTESEGSQIDQATAAGVNDFISKPFSSEQLRKRIEAALAAARS